jgi:hypothetical protein
MLGIAGAHADDQDISHVSAFSNISPYLNDQSIERKAAPKIAKPKPLFKKDKYFVETL